MTIAPEVRGAGVVFVVQLIAWYFIVPYIFSGQSKATQWAIILAIVFFTTFNTYRGVKGLSVQNLKNKAAAEAEVARLQAIVAKGPKEPGYQKAVTRLVQGIRY